jgi:hypothetical protein
LIVSPQTDKKGNMLNGQKQAGHIHLGQAKGVPAHLVHGAKAKAPAASPKAAVAATVTRRPVKPKTPAVTAKRGVTRPGRK